MEGSLNFGFDKNFGATPECHDVILIERITGQLLATY
jgi:hypothetical protein